MIKKSKVGADDSGMKNGMVKHYMPWFSCPHPPHAGLGVRAQNAKMTLDDGYSEQQYWLTDLKGKKVGSVPGIGMATTGA